MATIDRGEWYRMKDTGDIFCGECAIEDVQKTIDGEYIGDEAVTPDMYELITDADYEPYQCDGCLSQNPAYEEMENES